MAEPPQLPVSGGDVGWSTARIKAVVEQLREVGWSKVKALDEDLSRVVLFCKVDDNGDDQGKASGVRSCDLEVALLIPQGFPGQRPVVESVDLPRSSGFSEWVASPGGGERAPPRLSSLYRQFVDQVQRYSGLRMVLDHLDWHTWVLDPLPPQGDCRRPCYDPPYRRIVVSRGVSLHIDLGPEDDVLGHLPALKFMGPDKAVSALQSKLRENQDMFDSELDLVTNLQRILEVELPARPPPPGRTDGRGGDHHDQPMVQVQDDFSVDCGICYVYRLGEALPTISCNNACCSKMFHHECLFEWLQSNPDNRENFVLNIISGQCPYCEQTISCRRTS